MVAQEYFIFCLESLGCFFCYLKLLLFYFKLTRTFGFILKKDSVEFCCRKIVRLVVVAELVAFCCCKS